MTKPFRSPPAPMPSTHQPPLPRASNRAANALWHELQVTHHHRAALASLKLATYALDAMRVLHRIEAQARISPAFQHAIREVCPDWRNPGWLDDPSDLLVSVMTYSSETLKDFIAKIDEAWVDGCPGVG